MTIFEIKEEKRPVYYELAEHLKNAAKCLYDLSDVEGVPTQAPIISIPAYNAKACLLISISLDVEEMGV